MRDARIDEASLLQPGDDFDRMTERGAGALEKPALALRAAQRIGAHDAHAVGMHGPQALSEALQAAQRARRGGIVEPAAVAQPRARRTISRSRSRMTSWPCEWRATTM